jgi:DNA-binding transcriptional LysR family regulator
VLRCSGRWLASSPLLAALLAVPIRAIDGLDFVLSEAGGGPVILPLLQRHDARLNVRYHFTQVVSILEFVRRGLGVSVAAGLALPDDHAGVVYRPLLPTQPGTVGLACLDVSKLSPLARAFWDVAIAQAKARYQAQST